LRARRESRALVWPFPARPFPMITGQMGFLQRPGSGVKGAATRFDSSRRLLLDPFSAFALCRVYLPLKTGTGRICSIKAERGGLSVGLRFYSVGLSLIGLGLGPDAGMIGSGPREVVADLLSNGLIGDTFRKHAAGNGGFAVDERADIPASLALEPEFLCERGCGIGIFDKIWLPHFFEQSRQVG
jgi:hypothetical protein